MSEAIHRKSRQSALLLIGILLTLVLVAGHRFLPERRLTIDSAQKNANFMLVQTGNGAAADFQWIDRPHFHFACWFPNATAMQGCGFAYMLAPAVPDKGIDLSRFHTLNLAVRYTGKAQYLRVAIRNFDPKFSKIEDTNSPKYNFVNILTRDLDRPIAINMSEFSVAEWWTAAYNLSREYSHPDLSNATVLNIDLQGELAGTRHDIQIDRVEFVGDWISTESWYLGIMCVWMVVGTVYGTSQLVLLRRKHREQRKKIHDLVDSNAHLQSEKEKFEKLSTTDGLTKVLNRHGIERFVASLPVTNVPTSVIVIDLDHFKRVNDQRGHHAGDRVLQMVGEILRTHTRGTDGLGRWGGEEFVLVCPGANLAKAADLAEKLRLRLMGTNFDADDPLRVTASFGVAQAHDDRGFDDAFRQADEALYLAKSRGRNCVVAASEDQLHQMTGASKGTWALISGRFKLHT